MPVRIGKPTMGPPPVTGQRAAPMTMSPGEGSMMNNNPGRMYAARMRQLRMECSMGNKAACAELESAMSGMAPGQGPGGQRNPQYGQQQQQGPPPMGTSSTPGQGGPMESKWTQRERQRQNQKAYGATDPRMPWR